MKDSFRTILFVAVLGLICATLLTAAARITDPYKKSNARAEKIYNILKVLEVPFDDAAAASDLVTLFEANVQVDDSDGLTMYAYTPATANGVAQAVAFSFTGQGLWGPIKGFLAMEADMKTIRGITFHEQEETPGLGGEIGSQRFQAQFRQKQIHDANGLPGMYIRRGGAVGLNEVDAITGATMTCEKVEIMLNELIVKISEAKSHE